MVRMPKFIQVAALNDAINEAFHKEEMQLIDIQLVANILEELDALGWGIVMFPDKSGIEMYEDKIKHLGNRS